MSGPATTELDSGYQKIVAGFPPGVYSELVADAASWGKLHPTKRLPQKFSHTH